MHGVLICASWYVWRQVVTPIQNLIIEQAP
jgi:hypothetical protein